MTASAAPSAVATASRTATPEGRFGGDGVELVTSFAGTRLELACAHVEAPGPLRTGANGEIALDATFVPEGPGPEPSGGRPRRAARLVGTLEGDRISVSGTFLDTKEPFGTWSLVRDRLVRIIKCK